MRFLAVELFRLTVWLILLLAVFVPLERLAALHPRKVFRKAFSTDVVYYFLSSLAPRLALILPLTLIAAAVHRLGPNAYYSWLAARPLWLRLLAALLVGELGAYWAHRWSHEIPLLWRFHAIHHSAQEIDWLVNSRAHPVDIVFTRLCDMIPIYLLGLAQPMGNTLDVVPALVTILGTMWGFFIHANVRWRFGFLERMISTPAFHHWHHTNDSPALIDRNYAAMLPLLDVCFGTFHVPHHWPETYGTDTPVAETLTGQLLHPLLEPPAQHPTPISDLPS